MMFGLILAAIPVVLLFMYWMKEPHKNLPPGPQLKYVVGNYADLDKKRVHQSLHQMALEHGPVMYLRLLQRNVVVLSSAEMLRKGFQTKEFAKKLNDKPQGFYGTYLVWGHQDVLLGPYSDVTFKLKAVMRRGLEPSMSPDKIREEAELLCDLITEKDGKDFCPLEIVEKVYAKGMSAIISGYDEPGDTELLWDFVTSSNNLLNPSIEVLLKNMPFLRHLPAKPGHLYKVAVEKRDNLLRRYVDNYKCTYCPGKTRGLVDACLDIQSKEKDDSGRSWLLDDMIKAVVIDTIGGGLVATTHSVAAAILNLLHHPDCVKKMQAEVRSVLKPGAWVTGSDIKNLPYCHAAILESSRLSIVVPLVSHQSSEDVEFEGYTIPKGSIVWGNFWSSHHDEALWPEPWKFKPERFLDDQGRLLPTDHIHRQSLTPLGLGARYCVGDEFARVRMFVHVVTLVQRFDLGAPKDSDLLSNDPNLFTCGAVLQVQRYNCRALPRKF